MTRLSSVLDATGSSIHGIWPALDSRFSFSSDAGIYWRSLRHPRNSGRGFGFLRAPIVAISLQPRVIEDMELPSLRDSGDSSNSGELVRSRMVASFSPRAMHETVGAGNREVLRTRCARAFLGFSSLSQRLASLLDPTLLTTPPSLADLIDQCPCDAGRNPD